jgi:hypothetical protein
VKPPSDGPAVPLHRPSMDELLARDPALTVAIEGRRSVRDYDEQPMTAEHLGESLYRVARVRGHHVPSADGGEEVGLAPRDVGRRLHARPSPRGRRRHRAPSAQWRMVNSPEWRRASLLPR